jgi:hypothetical protein
MKNRHQSTPDFQTLFEAAPGLYLVLLPNAPLYTIVAVSEQLNEAERRRIATSGTEWTSGSRGSRGVASTVTS